MTIKADVKQDHNRKTDSSNGKINKHSDLGYMETGEGGPIRGVARWSGWVSNSRVGVQLLRMLGHQNHNETSPVTAELNRHWSQMTSPGKNALNFLHLYLCQRLKTCSLWGLFCKGLWWHTWSGSALRFLPLGTQYGRRLAQIRHKIYWVRSRNWIRSPGWQYVTLHLDPDPGPSWHVLLFEGTLSSRHLFKLNVKMTMMTDPCTFCTWLSIPGELGLRTGSDSWNARKLLTWESLSSLSQPFHSSCPQAATGQLSTFHFGMHEAPSPQNMKTHLHLKTNDRKPWKFLSQCSVIPDKTHCRHIKERGLCVLPLTMSQFDVLLFWWSKASIQRSDHEWNQQDKVLI